MMCNRCDRAATHRVQVEDREVLSCDRHAASSAGMASGFALNCQITPMRGER